MNIGIDQVEIMELISSYGFNDILFIQSLSNCNTQTLTALLEVILYLSKSQIGLKNLQTGSTGF